MRVLQFGFGADPGAETYLPHRFVRHCLAYTGTHDNDTTLGWFTSTDLATTQSREELEAERAFVRRYVDRHDGEIHWAMIRLAHASIADTAIIPMQDILGLDSRARMNRPGSAEGNWTWRFEWDQLGTKERAKLSDITAVYGRWNGPVPAELDPRFRPAHSPKPPSPEPGQPVSNQ
jgi:4-alpha-glucanotransferase